VLDSQEFLARRSGDIRQRKRLEVLGIKQNVKRMGEV